MGFENEADQSFGAASPFDEQRVQADMRSHLIHRPARTSCHRAVEFAFSPIGFDLALSCGASVQRNSVPSTQMLLLTHFATQDSADGPSRRFGSALAEAGLPVICVETRHMRAVLKAQINKTGRNDARGLGVRRACGRR
jgi:hypothetical protein